MRFAKRKATSRGSAPGHPSRGGDHAAEFGRQILPHLDGAYNLARYLIRDAALAEDVAQDAMLRAFRAFGQFRGGSPRAWLFAIVRNCCRTQMAVPVAVPRSDLSDEALAQFDFGTTPEDEALRKSEVERVRLAIVAIPEPFREAVVLRDLEELSYAEIAEVTGVPMGTVMSRLSRGRTMLANELLPQREGEQSRSAK